MELIPSVQKYSWGKKGSESLVGRLMKDCNKGNFTFSENDNYAELWIGTHPNGPAIISETNQPLKDWIRENPSALGEKVLGAFGPELPFLLKILSVQTALSIQAHPDKPRAQKLHAEFPDVYKDGNHKPEMAIALTQFEVLCGFREISQIQVYLNDIPELKAVIGDSVSSGTAATLGMDGLKSAFSSLMKCDPDLVKEQLLKLLTRIEAGSVIPEADLIKRLATQYPGDVGIFCVFFLQHLILKPGEAVFLPANEPHAYISGDCVECMATSDNVVRAGLTPKFKDVETLTDMLTYKTGNNWIMQGQKLLSYGTLYNPPVPEFAVLKYQISSTISSKIKDTCSVFLCVEGTGKIEFLDGSTKSLELKPGSCVFVPVGATEGEIEITPDDNGDLVLYQAVATP